MAEESYERKMSKADSFSEEGFLSGEVDKLAQRFRDRNVHYFALYRRIGRIGYKTITELQNDSRDARRGIVTCLIIRTLSSYDAIRLCIERGMEFETRVLLRSQLEGTYAVAACEKDKKFHEPWIQASTRERHQLLSRLLRNKDKVNLRDETKLKESVEALEKRLQNAKIPTLKTKQIAEKGGMLLSYESAYSFYSLSVHVNPISLQEYIVWNDNVGIEKIVLGPRYERASSYMLSSMNTMIVCLLAGTKIFNLNVEPEIKQMFDQWQKLARKDKKNKAASQGSQR